MKPFEKRISDTWIYPHICSYQDHVDNISEYFSFLDHPSKNKEIMIYIHIPFCDSMCFFCPFYKEHVAKYNYEQMKELFLLYKVEIENYARREYFNNATVKVVQFGGGSPSAIPPEFIELIIQAIRDNFNMSQCPTIRLEGNVMNLQDEKKLRIIKNLGVNSISFGVQTFNEELRKKLKIKANISDVYQAMDAIKNIGFDDHSADLIYNLPDQAMTDLEYDIKKIDELGTTYIDMYNLNIFENTIFKKMIDETNYFLDKPTNAKEISMWRFTIEYLKQNKYNHVVANTFSKSKKMPHIITNHYLNGNDVIAIGPSARGFIDYRNYKNATSIEKYISKMRTDNYSVDCGNISTQAERIERAMVFFPIRFYLKKSDIIGLNMYQSIIDELIKNGYAVDCSEYIFLTDEGKIWSGNIAMLFFNERQKEKLFISSFKSIRYENNTYNQDKMGM